MEEKCGVCGKPVQVQIMKNTGACSARCKRKAAQQGVNAVSE